MEAEVAEGCKRRNLRRLRRFLLHFGKSSGSASDLMPRVAAMQVLFKEEQEEKEEVEE